MAKKRGPKVRVLLVHADGTRKIVCNLKKFAIEQGMSYESAASLAMGREVTIKGWYSTRHPKFKERYEYDNKKIINLKTKEIVSLTRLTTTCAKKLNVAFRRLYGLRIGERATLKDWMLLDTYNKIYGDNL